MNSILVQKGETSSSSSSSFLFELMSPLGNDENLCVLLDLCQAAHGSLIFENLALFIFMEQLCPVAPDLFSSHVRSRLFTYNFSFFFSYASQVTYGYGGV